MKTTITAIISGLTISIIIIAAILFLIYSNKNSEYKPKHDHISKKYNNINSEQKNREIDNIKVIKESEPMEQVNELLKKYSNKIEDLNIQKNEFIKNYKLKFSEIKGEFNSIKEEANYSMNASMIKHKFYLAAKKELILLSKYREKMSVYLVKYNKLQGDFQNQLNQINVNKMTSDNLKTYNFIRDSLRKTAEKSKLKLEREINATFNLEKMIKSNLPESYWP